MFSESKWEEERAAIKNWYDSSLAVIDQEFNQIVSSLDTKYDC